ncbi:hypothetical protein DMENIID0001_119400 [Sergentomyia squamirostris]
MDPNETDIGSIVSNWGLKATTIERLSHCGINKINHLRLMSPADLDIIFSDDRRLGEKIIFRESLKVWREENRFEPDVVHEEFNGLHPTTHINNRENHNVMKGETSADSITSSPPNLPEAVAFNSATTSHQYMAAGGSPSFNLRQILYHNPRGIELLESYQNLRKLTVNEQLFICHVIVDYHLSTRHRMLYEDMAYYSNQIVQAFPTEKEETYFSRKGGVSGRPHGKLYFRYSNTVKKLKKRDNMNGNSPLHF